MNAFWVFMNCAWVGGLILAVVVICLVREARESDRMIAEIRRLRNRERVIVHMLKEGFSVARIARELQVSSETVKAIVQRMEAKEARS